LGDGWTDERVELLKVLWADNSNSASMIAGELGGGMTRNGVIGKVHRLGLSGRAKPPPRPGFNRVTHGKACRASQKIAAGQVRRKSKGPTPPKPLPVTEAPGAQPRMVDLLTLTGEDCHYPYDQPTQSSSFAFCGCSVVSGLSYCAGHLMICTQVK
jgi:GcrA cell cycle regulator